MNEADFNAYESGIEHGRASGERAVEHMSSLQDGNARLTAENENLKESLSAAEGAITGAIEALNELGKHTCYVILRDYIDSHQKEGKL